MNKKQLYTLIVILIIAVGAWFLLRSTSEEESIDSPAALDFSSLQTDNVSKLTLAQGEQSLILEKTSEGWKTGEYPADQDKIDSLLMDFSEAKVTQMVSKNPENHSKFEVDDTKGINITIKEGEDEKTFILGKTASSSTVYARVPDKDEVYTLSSLSRYDITMVVDDYRSKEILRFTREDAVYVEYVYGTKSFALNKIDEAWTITESGQESEADADKVTELLGSLRLLDATGFAETEENEDLKNFDSPDVTITINDAGGNNLGTVKLNEKDDESYVAQAEGKQSIFALSKAAAENILKQTEDLVKE